MNLGRFFPIVLAAFLIPNATFAKDIYVAGMPPGEPYFIKGQGEFGRELATLTGQQMIDDVLYDVWTLNPDGEDVAKIRVFEILNRRFCFSLPENSRYDLFSAKGGRVASEICVVSHDAIQPDNRLLFNLTGPSTGFGWRVKN